MSGEKRTKLDQIVEEAMQRPSVAYWSEHAKNTFKKIAEKIAELSFRHGVEQCSRLDDYRTEVQPAPAEQKATYGWANTRRCICYAGRPVGEHYCPCVCHQDRRKGERRKAYDWVIGAWHARTEHGCRFGVNRRSGNDRRKK